jgi:hypothetical protein
MRGDNRLQKIGKSSKLAPMNNPAAPQSKIVGARSGASNAKGKRREKPLLALCRVTH